MAALALCDFGLRLRFPRERRDMFIGQLRCVVVVSVVHASPVVVRRACALRSRLARRRRRVILLRFRARSMRAPQSLGSEKAACRPLCVGCV